MNALRPLITKATLIAVATLAFAAELDGQLNSNCTVSVLNRTTQVRADGSWDLPNVPSGFGPVRARATCVENGVTRSGESPLFVLVPGGTSAIRAFPLGAVTPVPTGLSVSPAAPALTSAGASVQLTVTATYSASAERNVTAGSTGTVYTVSNPAIATVSADGLVRAGSSGNAVVQVTNEGASALIPVRVALAGDSDSDGIPDDVERTLGLNPNDPSDGLFDQDFDGLTNAAEIARGSDIRNADTDNDGLRDGDEVARGTNPSVRDSDGDGIGDGLEVQAGTNPLDNQSYNLGAVLSSISVSPRTFTLTVNSASRDVHQQLTVTGTLRDNSTVDLTRLDRGTAYTSSDLSVCNFGSQPGRIYGGRSGPCTITIRNNGFTAEATGAVRSFTPVQVSSIRMPWYANNVDVSGDLAYVAADTSGLRIVDVSDRLRPRIVGSLDTPGTAQDVFVSGNTAYVADGSAGLRLVNAAIPSAPASLGSIDTPGVAMDVVVRNGRAYVADFEAGLQVIDVSNPAAPVRLGSFDTPGLAQGVELSGDGTTAYVADGAQGVQILDVRNPAQITRIATAAPGGDVKDIAVSGSTIFVADTRGFTSIDVSTPANPVVHPSVDPALGGRLTDIVVLGSMAFGADIFFVNGVPILDISNPVSPQPRFRLDFPGDADGRGIAVDDVYVYLTAHDTLYIGQHAPVGSDTTRPVTRITQPVSGLTVYQQSPLTVKVDSSDDVAVLGVEFYRDDILVSTDYAAPYELTFNVPVVTGPMKLGARTIDPGGNPGEADPVTVNVIPDVTGPAITFVSPVEGASAIEGTTLNISANISDEVAVAGVELQVNGQPIRFFTAPPYSHSIALPAGRSSLRLTLRATDRAGNISSVSRTISIIPDPLTTVTGRVLLSSGAPVPGATVSYGSVTAVSGVDGTFRLAGVPTIQGDVFVHATGNVGQHKRRTASMAVVPVPAGTAYVGDLIILDSPAAPPPELFDREYVLKTGAGAGRLMVSDLNRDTFPDVLHLSPATGDVSIFLGTADATFRPEQRISLGSKPMDIAIGSFNDDNVPDLIVGGGTDRNVAIHYGAGDGGFTAGPVLTVSHDVGSVAALDANGDSRQDIIALPPFGNFSAGSVFIATAARTFGTPVRSLSSRVIRAIADLDRDGKQDLMLYDGSYSTSVVLSNGDGTFRAVQQLSSMTPIAVADVNGDSYPDYLSTSELRFGSATGIFGAPVSGSSGIFNGWRVAQVAIADANGDGQKDLIACAQNGLLVALNNGNSTFAPKLTEFKNCEGGMQPIDAGADGKSDLLLQRPFSESGFLVLRGNGDGTFPTSPTFSLSSSSFGPGANPSGLVVADLDRDNRDDVTWTQFGLIAPAYGTADGAMRRAPGVNVWTSGTLHAGDMNRDGSPDIVSFQRGANSTSAVIIRTVGGSMTTPALTPIDSALSPQQSVLTDVTRDGIPDLVFLSSFNAVYCICILPGNGEGGFGSLITTTLAKRPMSIAVADFNRDGFADYAVVVDEGYPGWQRYIAVMPGTATGIGQEVRIEHSDADRVITADLNDDGNPDLIVSSSPFIASQPGSGIDVISVLLGQGEGTFLNAQSFPGTGAFLEAADVDGDGKKDLIDMTFTMWPGLGTGRFLAPRAWASATAPTALAIGDVNGDGKNDIVTHSATSDTTSVGYIYFNSTSVHLQK